MFRVPLRLCAFFFFVFLIVLIATIFLFPSLAGSFTQAFASQQEGLGGAYGATSINQLPQQTTFGGSGPNGVCLGTNDRAASMINRNFGWSKQYLSKKYRNDTADLFCNDHYIWQTTENIPVQKVLQTLEWPLDLLTQPYASQIVTIKPLQIVDPNTQQALRQQQNQQQAQQDQPKGPCDWVPNLLFAHPHIDVCAPIRLLVGAGANAIRSIYQATAKQIDFLWTTPLQPFQDNKSSGLLSTWLISWEIVLGCIGVVIAYGMLRYMIGSAVNWLAYSNIVESIPRLLFGLLAAYYSQQFFIMLIKANNAVASIFNHSTLDSVLTTHPTGVIDGSLQIVYGIMGFLLIIEGAARIAIIYLLFAFAPILFFLASLRETQRWAKTSAVAAVLFIFLQAIQAASLNVGGKVLSSVLHNQGGQLNFLNLLVSLAILYVTLMLFFSTTRVALGGGSSPLGLSAFGLSLGLGPSAAGFVGKGAGQARKLLGKLPLAGGPPTSPQSNIGLSGNSPGGGSGGQSGTPARRSGGPSGGQSGGGQSRIPARSSGGQSSGGQSRIPARSSGGQSGSGQSRIPARSSGGQSSGGQSTIPTRSSGGQSGGSSTGKTGNAGNSGNSPGGNPAGSNRPIQNRQTNSPQKSKNTSTHWQKTRPSWPLN